MSLLPWIVAGAMLAMTALWEVQRRRRDAGVVDAGWALLLAAAAVAAGVWGDGHPANRILVAVLGGCWGVRLGLHLVRDRLIGRPEDGRYQAMRAAMGAWAQPGFFVFFQVQAGLVAVFSIPFLLAAGNPVAGWPWIVPAVAVWLVAILGESLADRQLARFRADPANRGRVCDRGLWRYSRHPNYFFEWLHWFAYALLASGGPGAAWAWVFPPLMLAFLLFLTGIPFTERRALATRGAAYAAYQRRTSVFIPWFPKDST